jgi:hypothetical protein
MPDLNDEQFKNYLQRFRPVMADPLPNMQGRPTRRLGFVAWSVAAAAVLLVALLLLRISSKSVDLLETNRNAASIVQIVPRQPLTIGSANALLARSTSMKVAVDLITFRPQSPTFPKGTQSALTVLSKEKNKL